MGEKLAGKFRRNLTQPTSSTSAKCRFRAHNSKQRLLRWDSLR
jgi:hypothetical protein